MIRVVGLGVKDGDLSLRGACAIDAADTVIVKTALTETYRFFEEEGIEHLTCDAIYESAADFDDLDEKIAEFVLRYADGNVCYCVNGGGTDDRSVRKLFEKSAVEIICGVSRETEALTVAPATVVTAVTAYDLADDPCFVYDTAYSLVVKEIGDAFVASQVKRALTRLIGEETEIVFTHGGKSENIPVYALDRYEDYDYGCTVTVVAQPFEKKERYQFADLMRVMRRLRGKNGCEWDKAQTHASIRANVIEEAYELADAIDADDVDNMIEESGDIILQGVFHSVIGEDEGEFEAYEPVDALCKKLISRHTHIFGDVTANNAEEALQAWEAAKSKEKQVETASQKINRTAKTLPGLMYAEKLQKIVRKAGLDLADRAECLDKLYEEIKEYLEANTPEELEKEGGDILFAAVNVLRKDGVEPEVALRGATNRFAKRVEVLEKRCAENRIEMKDATAAQMDQWWKEAKSDENR